MPFTPADPGKFNRRVQVQSPMPAPADAFNETPLVWAFEANRWAGINALSGRDVVIAQQVNPLINQVVKMRRYPGLSTHWRIVYGSRIFNIIWVTDPEEAHAETWAYCEEHA